jgi:hypothetical protein
MLEPAMLPTAFCRTSHESAADGCQFNGDTTPDTLWITAAARFRPNSYLSPPELSSACLAA